MSTLRAQERQDAENVFTLIMDEAISELRLNGGMPVRAHPQYDQEELYAQWREPEGVSEAELRAGWYWMGQALARLVLESRKSYLPYSARLHRTEHPLMGVMWRCTCLIAHTVISG